MNSSQPTKTEPPKLYQLLGMVASLIAWVTAFATLHLAHEDKLAALTAWVVVLGCYGLSIIFHNIVSHLKLLTFSHKGIMVSTAFMYIPMMLFYALW